MIIVGFACRQVKDDLQPGHAASIISLFRPRLSSIPHVFVFCWMVVCSRQMMMFVWKIM